MNDKEYLDRDGLTYYDTLLKRYVKNEVDEAIAEYEAEDGIIIYDWVPPVVENSSGE